MPTTPKPGTVLAECLTAAVAAPSVHNTQPWRFLVRPDGIDIYADRSRQLIVIDPRGRELWISIGAAILNLRVALLAHGRVPLLRLLPDPDDKDLAARVTVGPPTHPDQTIRSLADAIPRRHTNRRPFASTEVPEQVIRELATAARVEDATLTMLDDLGQEAVLNLVRSADTAQQADPEYRRELAEWTRPRQGRTDGIPPAAFGPWDALESVPLRDFGLAQPTRPRRAGHFEEHPQLALLSTRGDGPAEWLRAGQALARVLLTATVRGVATTPMTQPIEHPEMRTLLGTAGDDRVAQVILRVGYGPPSAATPRRPLSDVLVTEE